MTAERMAIGRLRREMPEWRWTAARQGFGWQYIGYCAGRLVRVHAVAVLCGPAEDDTATQWRVTDGRGRTVTYSAWWLRERARLDERARRARPLTTDESGGGS